MLTFSLAAALAAYQPPPAPHDADLRCVAALAAASEFKEPDQVALLADPELEERAVVHMVLVRERIVSLPAAQRETLASAFKAVVDEAKQSARAFGDAAAFVRERVERCRATVHAALSAAAARLSLPADQLPLAYLRCTVVYAMFHGVAYRRESAHWRYGARMGEMFSKLYAERRFRASTTQDQKTEIWNRDYQAVEAEANSRSHGSRDDRQQCLLLAISNGGA